VIQVAGNI